jgi:hypothetical protein
MPTNGIRRCVELTFRTHTSSPVTVASPLQEALAPTTTWLQKQQQVWRGQQHAMHGQHERMQPPQQKQSKQQNGPSLTFLLLTTLLLLEELTTLLLSNMTCGAGAAGGGGGAGAPTAWTTGVASTSFDIDLRRTHDRRERREGGGEPKGAWLGAVQCGVQCGGQWERAQRRVTTTSGARASGGAKDHACHARHAWSLPGTAAVWSSQLRRTHATDTPTRAQ